MANFHKAMEHLFKVEGTAYTNRDSDAGGPTKFGITQRTLDKWCRLKNDEELDVKYLTKYQALEIYRKFYWDKLMLSQASQQAYALVLFDQGVNQGIERVVIRLQQVLNHNERDCRLVVDGIMGPKTLRQLNTAKLRTMIEFLKASQLYYATITRDNPFNAANIKGWIARTHILWDVLRRVKYF